MDARIEPAEAEVIREAAKRLLAAEPLAHIAADFNDRGLRTVRGGQWKARNLGRMLAAPRYGGYAVMHGEVVGKVAGEPVLDEDTYAEVQGLLAGRRQGRRESGRWPLTGVPRCGNPDCARAGRGMAGRTETRVRADGTSSRQYTCPRSNGGCGMAVLAEPVEERVRARVLADLADADELAELAGRERALNESKAAAAAEVERLEGLLAGLEAKLAAETIRRARLRRGQGGVRPAYPRGRGEAGRDRRAWPGREAEGHDRRRVRRADHCGEAGADRPAAAGGHRAAAASGRAAQQVRPGAGADPAVTGVPVAPEPRAV